jgi:dihydrolipoamide dehydrogenase
MQHVDVAVLGAGTAGLNARRAAEKLGATAVMVDPGPYGTTCARVGCMPSKLLIAAAEATHHARHAGFFGVDAEPKVQGRRVMDRVRRERDRFVGFVNEDIEEHIRQGRLLPGRASFLDENTLDVGGKRLAFKTAVIATGSTPFVPPPFRDTSWITNDHVFDWEDLPESLFVVGSGVIGLELGQALARLGVRTTIVGRRGVIGPLSDPVVLGEAARVFSAELDLRPDYALHGAQADEGGVRVQFDDQDQVFEHVLMAAGRRPNLHNLGLGDTSSLPVDPLTQQLGDTNLFVAGDVTNFRPLLHEASDEGKSAGTNAARWPHVLPSPRRVPLGIVFTDPNIAVVGTPFSQLPEGAVIGEVDYGRQGRARVMNQHRGVVRIYGDPVSRRILGSEMLGPRVEHTAHLLAWSIQQELTVDDALAMPFYHPVIEEGIRTALQDLARSM